MTVYNCKLEYCESATQDATNWIMVSRTEKAPAEYYCTQECMVQDITNKSIQQIRTELEQEIESNQSIAITSVRKMTAYECREFLQQALQYELQIYTAAKQMPGDAFSAGRFMEGMYKKLADIYEKFLESHPEYNYIEQPTDCVASNPIGGYQFP